MSHVTDFGSRAKAYADRSGLAVSTVSRKLLGNGVRLDELEAGKSLRVDILERALGRLEDMERAA